MFFLYFEESKAMPLIVVEHRRQKILASHVAHSESHNEVDDLFFRIRLSCERFLSFFNRFGFVSFSQCACPIPIDHFADLNRSETVAALPFVWIKQCTSFKIYVQHSNALIRIFVYHIQSVHHNRLRSNQARISEVDE